MSDGFTIIYFSSKYGVKLNWEQEWQINMKRWKCFSYLILEIYFSSAANKSFDFFDVVISHLVWIVSFFNMLINLRIINSKKCYYREYQFFPFIFENWNKLNVTRRLSFQTKGKVIQEMKRK